MTKHAKLMPPSSSARRIVCPGSYPLEAALPDTSSTASDDGTAMHEVASWCLAPRPLDVSASDAPPTNPHAYVGRLITVSGLGEPKRTVEFTEAMADLVQPYVDDILRRAVAPGVALRVEDRVSFARYLGVDDAYGTADAVLVLTKQRELQVHDFKSGFHFVNVKRNPQLMLYALGVYDTAVLVHEIDTITLFIHQPRLHDEPASWSCTVAELMAFADEAKRAAHACKAAMHCVEGSGVDSARFAEEYLRPGDEQCRFCKAKPTCPALRGQVAQAVACTDDFEVLDPQADPVATQTSVQAAVNALPVLDGAQVGRLMQMSDLVELWLKAVRGEVERRLLAGQQVPGFKLVQGKKGPRKWTDAAAAEEMLKTFRLKTEEMYELRVISPTAAEKLAPAFGKDGKAKPPKEGAPAPLIGPRQWPKLQALITQSPGSPSVTTADDPRPALEMTPPADDFEVVAEAPAPAPREVAALEDLL